MSENKETKESEEKSDNEEINKEEKIPDKILSEINEFNTELHENYTVLSRKIRIFIFSLFLILSVVVDLESGIFNSSVDQLKKDLDMNNAQYGLFVSISFTGRIIGLVIFMVLLNFKHRKFTLIATIFLHGSSYALYKISTNSTVLTFAKMFAAGNKVCATIYRPVWIEQFGLSNYKSVFFSLVQIMSSYGQIIGFSLGSYLFENNWQWGMISILIMMYIIGIGFLLCPGKYFYRSYMYYEEKLVDIDKDQKEREFERESVKSEKNDGDSCDKNNDNDNVSKDFVNAGKKSKNNNNSANAKRGTIFVDSKKAKKKSGTKKGKKSLRMKINKISKEMLSLIKNKIYLLSTLKRANITFILQIIHSYLKPYQTHSLNDVDQDLLVVFYTISSLVSTAIGGLLGGVITKKLGGYESKKSLYVVIIPEIITTITISLLAFTKDFYTYNINLILFFCFVSVGSPVIQGYLIKTIPKSIKGIGVGLDIIISTFLGKIPGPVIYGALEDEYKDSNPWLAWRLCMSYFYIGLIIVIPLCYYKYKGVEVDKDSNEVNIKDNIVDIAAISSGTGTNDLFSIKMPVPKRSKSVVYQSQIFNSKNYLSAIIEKSEKDESSETGRSIENSDDIKSDSDSDNDDVKD